MIVDRFGRMQAATFLLFRYSLRFPGIGKSGLLFCRAFRDHRPGQGIFGKLSQDVTIGQLCGWKISSLELLRGLPSHRAQLLLPIADPQVRIVALTKSEQFIDHELGFTTLHLNWLDRPCEYIGLRLVVDAVADADRGAKQLVDAFQAGSNVHAVPQGCIAQPVRGPDIADKDVGAIEPDPDLNSRPSFRLPCIVDTLHAAYRPHGSGTGA